MIPFILLFIIFISTKLHDAFIICIFECLFLLIIILTDTVLPINLEIDVQSLFLIHITPILNIIIFPILITKILRIISLWTIFKKENIPSWKAIIPFYGDYILCKITNTNTLFFILEFSPIFILISLIINIKFMNINTTLLLTIILIISKTIYSYILAKNTTKKFDKPETFSRKLFFFPLIYYIKLGLETNEETYLKEPLHKQ